MRPYPTLLALWSVPEARGVACYAIDHYGTEGISLAICIEKLPGQTKSAIKVGDWRGNRLDLTSSSAARDTIEMAAGGIIDVMAAVGLKDGQFYLAGGEVLVDVAIEGGNKLIGPGAVRDLFGKILPTQRTKKIVTLTPETLADVEAGAGDFAGDLILKPVRFRTIEREILGTCPLYVEVRR